MKSIEPLPRNRDPNMNQNEHFYAIFFCRPEAGDDVVVNFEGTKFITFRDLSKRSFCDGEVGDGSGDTNAICSRPEVADNVISGTDVDSFRY